MSLSGYTRLINRPLRLMACMGLALILAGWESASLPVLAAADQPYKADVIDSFSKLYSLGTEQLRANLPVIVDSVVLCNDPEWGQFYLYDGSRPCYLSPTAASRNLTQGQGIRLEAVTSTNSGGPLQDIQLTVTTRRPIPKPKVVRLQDFARSHGDWIQTTGIVRVTESINGRGHCLLQSDGISCVLEVLGPFDFKQAAGLRDAAVEVRGINNSFFTDNGHLATARITVPRQADIRVLEGQGTGPIKSPIISIEQLMKRELGPWTNQPVRLQGTIWCYKQGDFLTVRDPSGMIRAEVKQPSSAFPGDRVDVWGYLKLTPGETLLQNAWFFPSRFESSAPTVSSTSSVTNHTEASSASTLTSIAKVRGLRNEKALEALPVRVRGVVTYSDAEWGSVFVQDHASAIFVAMADARLQPGYIVELTGVTGAGSFAPILSNCSAAILGSTSLPVPGKTDLSDVSDGEMDCHWVELEGVVRQVTEHYNHIYLTLWSPKGSFRALVPNAHFSAATNLINVLVGVQGACGVELNARRQVSGILLHVPNLSYLKPLETIPANPFDIPKTPIAEIGTFSPDRKPGHRIKVTGTVTLAWPGQSFYLQDGSGATFVRADGACSLRAGDRIELLGFPSIEEGSPFLEAPVARVLDRGSIPPPLHATAQQLLYSQTNDAALVCVEAKLLQYNTDTVRPRLLLQDGSIIFAAQLVRRLPNGHLPQLREGSRIRVPGICELQSGVTKEPESFRILVFDPGAIQVLVPAAWWTTRETLILAGGLAFVTLCAVAWIGLLRRQVSSQTKMISEKLRERNQFAESLAYERDLLKTLMENLPDPIYFKDLQSRFVRVSKSKIQSTYKAAVASHSRAHPNELIGDYPEHLRNEENFGHYIRGKTDFDFSEPDRAQPAFDDEQQIISSGEPLIGKLEFYETEGGQPNWSLATKMPWRDKHGRIIGTFGISKNITSIKEAEAKLEKVHRELLIASRQAGMAEVATSVLHNVGNVLNSVNVSATVVANKIKNSKASSISMVAGLMRDHADRIGSFMTDDPRGQRLPEYLGHLAEHLGREQATILAELESLTGNIEHIKDIVTMQQSYAKVAGISEPVKPTELVEDALRMNQGALARHDVRVIREYQPDLPDIVVEKHKVLQVLVNIIRNAKYACDEAGTKNKQMTVRVANGGGRLKISVSDNGVGIAPENMTRIFSHGFTTRVNGHGFGLHSGALAAREMGGALTAQSDGPGRGATFTLELPLGNAELK